MTKKEWPHQIEVTFENPRARELLNWLNEQGLVLHDTVKFGGAKKAHTKTHVTWKVGFKDANKAMMFKLAWGGV